MVEDINIFLTKLNNNNKFQEEILSRLNDDPDFLDYSDIPEYRRFSGVMKSDKLIPLLYKCKKNKNISVIIPYLLYYADGSTITDDVFRIILRFPKQLRHTCLISLAHCHISFYQLQYINNLEICSEAFCQLLSYYCRYACFSAQDLEIFLKSCDLSRYMIIIDTFLQNNNCSMEKVKILQSIIATR